LIINITIIGSNKAEEVKPDPERQVDFGVAYRKLVKKLN
jgi:hypothetical protein